MSRLFAVVTLIAALVAAPMAQPARAASGYTITVIPAAPGTNNASPTSINAQGVVVGVLFSKDASDSTIVDAFAYQNGKTSLLPRIGSRSYADAVNASGVVVGSSIDQAASQSQAVKWENGQGVILPGFGSDSAAYSINDKGDLAGSATVSASGANWTHAVAWINGAVTDLGTLGGDSSEASSINASGQIAGASGTKAGAGSLLLDDTAHAFLWTNGVMTDLGTLGGDSSSATALNDKGQIVGWSGTTPGGGALAFDPSARAFVWDSGQMVNLGGLPGGSISSAASINNNGVIVGYAIDAQNQQRAVVWENGEIVDLNTLIPADSGLTLNAAYDINDAGQIVCGATTANGDFTGIILTPAA
jgi:probable HAF family extracellular repeat protein